MTRCASRWAVACWGVPCALLVPHNAIHMQWEIRRARAQNARARNGKCLQSINSPLSVSPATFAASDQLISRYCLHRSRCHRHRHRHSDSLQCACAPPSASASACVCWTPPPPSACIRCACGCARSLAVFHIDVHICNLRASSYVTVYPWVMTCTSSLHAALHRTAMPESRASWTSTWCRTRTTTWAGWSLSTSSTTPVCHPLFARFRFRAALSFYYLYGTTAAGVQYIIDSVVDALRRDVARRFTYVEMGYFYRWWREQSDARKAQVRALVNEGTWPHSISAYLMLCIQL